MIFKCFAKIFVHIIVIILCVAAAHPSIFLYFSYRFFFQLQNSPWSSTNCPNSSKSVFFFKLYFRVLNIIHVLSPVTWIHSDGLKMFVHLGLRAFRIPYPPFVAFPFFFGNIGHPQSVIILYGVFYHFILFSRPQSSVMLFSAFPSHLVYGFPCLA